MPRDYTNADKTHFVVKLEILEVTRRATMANGNMVKDTDQVVMLTTKAKDLREAIHNVMGHLQVQTPRPIVLEEDEDLQ